jgi:hypothetical protein
MPTDCEALAYQAAALSETVRLVGLSFLDALLRDWGCRLFVFILILLTQSPPSYPGAR